jgi:hypothetical protein
VSGGETWQIRKGATQAVVGWLMGDRYLRA